MKIINNGKPICDILTNHSMSLDEALDLCAEPYDKQYDDDPDYIIGGVECWYDDLDLIVDSYVEEQNF